MVTILSRRRWVNAWWQVNGSKLGEKRHLARQTLDVSHQNIVNLTINDDVKYCLHDSHAQWRVVNLIGRKRVTDPRHIPYFSICQHVYHTCWQIKKMWSMAQGRCDYMKLCIDRNDMHVAQKRGHPLRHRFNIKISYQYGTFPCGDKAVVNLSYFQWEFIYSYVIRQKLKGMEYFPHCWLFATESADKRSLTVASFNDYKYDSGKIQSFQMSDDIYIASTIKLPRRNTKCEGVPHFSLILQLQRSKVFHTSHLYYSFCAKCEMF